MALRYNPKIITDNLVLNLDPSHNKSYPTTDLPVKDGLALWLDAADDSTFSYSSGTSVSQWRDKSGNNRHFFQSTAGNQPSRSAVVNSRKAIQFTAASSQYLRYNSTIINNTTGGSVFVAWRTAGETSAYSSILDNYHCGSNALGAGFQIERNISNNQYYWGFQTSNCVQAGFIPATSYSNDTTNCIWITKDSTTITGGLNGTSATPSASPSSTWIEDTKGWTIGCWGGGTESFSRFYNGIHCEVIIFNRGLTTKEVKLINTYLGQKWGISNTDRSIIDLSGNSNDGLLGNGTTANMPTVDYYNNNSLRFDGSNDEVNFGDVIKFTNTQEFTLETWVNYVPNSTSYVPLISKEAASPAFGYALKVDETYNYYPYLVITGTQSYRYSLVNINDGRWHHVVGVAKSGTATIDMYIDGVLSNGLSSLSSWTGTATTNALRLGNNYGSAFFKGKLASSKIYNRALSAAEILQNYEAQKSKFTNSIVHQGLILNLDAGNPYSYAGAGTTWYDTSGAINDFTIANSPTYSTNEFILNGSTQFFYNTSAASGFFISSTNNFYADVGYAWTISVWFKFPVSPTNLRDGTNNGGNCSYCMVGNGGGIGGAETLALFVSGVNGTTAGYHPYYCIVGIRGAKTQLSTGSVNTNTWNHALVTWNGSVGRGYFNGVDVGALNIGSAGMQINGYTIGTQVGGNQGSHTYEGSLSQVFIYNRALSASEVLQNYNATKGRFGL